MAVSTGYDYSIRKGLNERGVDNSQIGWNPNTQTVTVGGRDFMKADKNYNNSAFTNQQNFSSAWDTFNKSQQQQPQLTGQMGQGWTQDQLTNAVTNPTMPDNRYTGQIDQQIAALLNMANNQQPINPYATPEYAAYAAQSGRRANQGIRAAQEALGSAGFGRSTALGERAQGIQNAETAYLETQVIPQLLAAEQNRRQQQFGNLYSLLEPLMGQQGYMDTRSQTERGNAMDALNLLLGEDQRAIDNKRQTRLDNLDAARLIGQDTGRVITPQEDWSGLIRQAINTDTPLNYDARIDERDFNYDVGRDKRADEVDDRNYRLDVQREGRISANQSRGGGSGGSSDKPSTDAVIQDINMPRTAAAMESYIINNLPGGKYIAGPPSPDQLTLIENMILANPNLSEADMIKLYQRFGIPLPE